MRVVSVICLLLAWTVSATALTLEAETRWEGEKVFTETVRVAPEVSLTIAAGTKVRFENGGLEVAGRLIADDVNFSGSGWTGILLKGCDETTRISNSIITDAKVGIKLQGGSPTLEALTIADNGVGIEVRGKATGSIVLSRFINNRKVGLFLKDESTTTVTGNIFKGNKRFGAYIYRAMPAEFRDNRFMENQTGLMIAYFGSDPLVKDNLFAENGTAIEVDRAACPVLRSNRISGNEIGIKASRRSDPLVTDNWLEKNITAMHISLSSYPVIKANSFAGNQMAIELVSQSSAWERVHGAAARAGETASRSAFAGQGMRSVSEDDRRSKKLDGTVQASGNWWGEAGFAELERIGSSGNPSFIHDGRDQATFVDAGEEYPLDKVVYSPWSDTALTESVQ